jgi:Immunity protein 74
MARRSTPIEVEITEGAIRVRLAGRVLTLPNASPPSDAEDVTDFFVRLDEIEHWDPPHDDVSIDIVELQKILEAIETQVEKHGLTVEFD